MIDYRLIKLLGPSGVLINTARGGIVNEVDLLQSLQNGSIGSAYFDVLEQEPPVNIELLEHPRFFATPHIGGSTLKSVTEMGLSAIRGVLRITC